MALIDACVRLLPGVMGKLTSGLDESFSDGLLEYPQYTRPQEFEGRTIPDVLLSGDHARVARGGGQRPRPDKKPAAGSLGSRNSQNGEKRRQTGRQPAHCRIGPPKSKRWLRIFAQPQRRAADGVLR
jgi:tRNA (guanine37-N1)-methyltransferase